jgi:hypothetical protein
MKLLFVHGWSVTHTDTYGGTPEALRRLARGRDLELRIADVFLGRYVSFQDEVRMGDLERAFEQAVRDALGAPAGEPIPRFSCITHSTGGPLVRSWMDRYYGLKALVDCPLEHLIMLAPANHGSPLAQLGKAKIGRIKACFEGIEPSVQILDWLEMGSAGQRELNERFLGYDLAKSHAAGGRHFPVVLTGETIDRSLYDFVNSYTGEAGSDGVVRTAGANLDTHWLTLEQTDEPVSVRGCRGATVLAVAPRGIRRAPPTPFRIVPNASHSGAKIGILKSVKPENASEKDVVAQIFAVLAIRDGAGYEAYRKSCDAANAALQKPGERSFQIVFRVLDDQGAPVTDFDLILLGGPAYDPNALPKGFFRDRQRNRNSPNTIVYYLNHDRFTSVVEGRFGLRVLARPDCGFAWYAPAEFRSDALTIDKVVDPNVTTYIDIVLKRRVDREAVRFDPESGGRRKFSKGKPSGVPVP